VCKKSFIAFFAFSERSELRSVKRQVRDSEYGFSGYYNFIYIFQAAAPSNKHFTTVSISFSLSSIFGQISDCLSDTRIDVAPKNEKQENFKINAIPARHPFVDNQHVSTDLIKCPS